MASTNYKHVNNSCMFKIPNSLKEDHLYLQGQKNYRTIGILLKNGLKSSIVCLNYVELASHYVTF